MISVFLSLLDLCLFKGVLTTCKVLDYEARQSYQLLILATSLGDTSYTSYVSVNVTVLDVNDNPPLFKVTRYSVQIREDVEVGQIVLKVEMKTKESDLLGLFVVSAVEIYELYRLF